MLAQLRKPRLILFILVFFAVLWLLWLARGAIAPFVVALVIAYLLLPLVNLIQRWMPTAVKQRNLGRPLSIVLVYLLAFGLIGLALMTIVQPIVDQVESLIDNLPDLIAEIQALLTQALAQYQDAIPPSIQARIEANIRQFDAMIVLDPLLGGTLQAVGAVRNLVSSAVGWLVIPFFLFFVLNDDSKFLKSTMQLIPAEFRPDAEALRVIVDRVLSGYIRGQLLVALEIGTLVTIGLILIDVQYALLLGIAAGLFGVIPFIGSILGALPAVIVAFLQEPQLALWTVLVFVVVQQIDNIIFSPRIMGQSVALHPAVIMVVIVVGTSLLGVLGAVVAVPLTAILRDIVDYLYRRMGEPPATPTQALTQIGYGEEVTPMMVDPVPATAGKMGLGANR